jgi:hypothetical protein
MSIDDLAVRELDTGLAVNREPDVVLEEAHRAAAALKRVLDAKPNKVMFGGEQYLEFEDWQTVGRFYGIAPRNVATRPLTLGEVSGWEATAEAIHVPTGRIVSSADAMCMNDEEKWRARPKYEWHYVKKSGGTSLEDPGAGELNWEPGGQGKKNRPKKERVLVGEEVVPSFQLRSMAQTRAAAKALRNALAWVVVLAGYRPTPAEELPEGPAVAPARVARVAPPRAEDAEFTPPAVDASGYVSSAPLNEMLERSILNEKIVKLGDALKYKANVRAELWSEHVGGDPREAPLEKLADFEAYLRKLVGGA